MFSSFFSFAKKIGNKNLWLKNSRFWDKCIRPIWIKLFLFRTREAGVVHYFTDNKKRVEKIVSLLADDESKKTYIKLIRFRCYGNLKKDFISHGADNQYFINDFFKWNENEVFIDCGAFDGDTIDKFISLHSKYSQIVAFEPDTKNYAKIQKKYENNPKVRIIKTGASDKNGELFFLADHKGMIRIVSEPNKNTISLLVSTIDSLDLPYVSIIKMDIEGAEMQALRGARNTILKYKPKLAICIYHSKEDMLQIAEYIHEIVPEYKLYVRHHGEGCNLAETVLYAQV